MAHRGLALARLSGFVVFVFGALPGEEILAKVTKVHRRHAFADTIQVYRASPHRVEPPCPYFGSCGGCQLQHLSYRYQLETKEAVLKQTLTGQGIELPATVESVAATDPWRYRWRGEFHQTLVGPPLGFKSRSSYDVVGVADCLIHHPTVTQSLPAVGAALRAAGRAVKTVQLTVGAGGEQLLVNTRPDRAASAQVAMTSAAGLSLGLSVTDESTSLTYRGREFRVFPEAFIQVGQDTVGELYETVVELLDGEIAGTQVVDAYGGIGILSLRLVDLGARVTVIESNPVAARLCQLHAEMYAPGQVTTICGPVEAELPRAEAAQALVLDPPRAGLAPELRTWLGVSGPPTVVYISCEVSALARDLRALCQVGTYRVERMRLIDMFPQTYHFETVVLLRRT